MLKAILLLSGNVQGIAVVNHDAADAYVKKLRDADTHSLFTVETFAVDAPDELLAFVRNENTEREEEEEESADGKCSHGWVEQEGKPPWDAVVRCPECGHRLSVDGEAEKVNPTTGRRVVVRAAFCGWCEFVHEF